MKQRLSELEKAGMPPETALPLILQEFKQQGVITPDLEQQINIEASKVGQIQEDPKLRQAAMQGLQLLQERSDRGFGAEEEAAFAEARQGTAKEAQGRLQSIIQQAQARGMGGSGAELAAQLSTAQAGDESLANQGLQIAAERAKAQREALTRAFAGATQMRGQDFDIARTKAQAEDELSRFRVSTEADRQSRNVAAQRRAEELNLAEKQRMTDLNVRQANEEQARQNAARQSDWLAKMKLAEAKGGIYREQAGQRIEEGSAAAKGWTDMGQGLGGAITGAGARFGAPQAPATVQPAQGVSIMNPTTVTNADILGDDYLGRKRY
jgi:hypothetical protein